MTKFTEQQSIPLFLPTYNADFDRILGNDFFFLLKEQILSSVRIKYDCS